MPFPYGLRHAFFLQNPLLKILLQKSLMAKGNLLPEPGPPVPVFTAEFLTAAPQLRLQLLHEPSLVRAGPVHLVYKKEYGNLVLIQQPPKSAHMALHPVRSAYNQNTVVQYLQRPLHLCAEIHMPRRVQQDDLSSLPDKLCLLGKDGDAPLSLQREIVQKSVPMVHPTRRAYLSSLI